MKVRNILAPAFGLVVCLVTSTLAAAEPTELKLWPSGAPGESKEPGETKVESGDDGILRITHVSDPTITVYRAPEETSNGCAVVICPGGAYRILAWDLEGTEVAEWLNSIGVTGVLLKYRVPRRDTQQPHKAPLQDAQRAIRLTRQNADAWGVDPDRIGALGFSAGGNLTVMAGTHWEETTYQKVDSADTLSCRPDFMAPIYAAYLGAKGDPWTLSPLVRVTDKTPPTFMAVTLDDAHRGAQAALLLVELKKAGVPAELHVYAKGGHGYGLRPSDDPVCGWPQRCEDWMRSSGLLQPGKSSEE